MLLSARNRVFYFAIIFCLTSSTIATADPSAPKKSDSKNPLNGSSLEKALIARLGSSHLRVTGDIRLLVFSPDGKYLAAGGGQKYVYVWEVKNGMLRGKIATANRYVQLLFFSPDSRQLKCYGEKLQAWSVPALQPKHVEPLEGDRKQHTVELARRRGKKLSIVTRGADIDVVRSHNGEKLLTVKRGHWSIGPILSHNKKMLLVPTSRGVNQGHSLQVWNIVTGKMIYTFTDLPSILTNIAVTKDDTRLFTAGSLGPVLQWDLTTGKKLDSILGDKARVRAMRLSPKGDKLVIAAGQSVAIYDPKTGKKIQTLKGLRLASSLAFSADGKTIAATYFNTSTVHLYDTEKGTELLPHSGSQEQIFDQAFSPDGKRLAVVSGKGTVACWDTTAKKILYQKRFLPQAARTQFAPNGEHLAAWSKRGIAFVWNATQADRITFVPRPVSHWVATPSKFGEILAQARPNGTIVITPLRTPKSKLTHRDVLIKGHAGGVLKLAFSPNHKLLASTGKDSKVRIWDTITGREQRNIDLKKSPHPCLAFSPDASYVATAADREILIWNVADGKVHRRWKAAEKGYLCLKFSPDGKNLAAGDRGGTITIWDASTGKQLHQQKGHEKAVSAIAYAPDGSLLCSGGADGAVHLWTAATLERLWTADKTLAVVSDISFDTGSKQLAVSGRKGTILAFDISKRRRSHRFTTNGRGAVSVSFSPENEQLVVANALGSSVVFDLVKNPTRGSLVVFSTSTDPDGYFSFLSDGNTTAIVTPHAIGLWDYRSGKNTANYPTSGNFSTAVAVSGGLLAAGGEGMVLWSLEKEKLLHRWPVEKTNWVRSVAFSPDGRRLATGSSAKDIRVWDTQSGQLLYSIPRITPVTNRKLRFTHDGRFLLAYDRIGPGSVNPHHALMLWEVASGKRLLQLKGFPQGTTTFSLSADGKKLSTGNYNGTCLVWDFECLLREILFDHQTGKTKSLQQLWDQLASPEPSVAYRAVGALTARGDDAVAFLQALLKPVPDNSTATAKEVDTLIKQLSSTDAKERRTASSRLRKLGPITFDALRRALNNNPPAQVRNRLNLLLAAKATVISTDELRTIRAIDTLERIGSTKASQVLSKLTQGASWAEPTRQAKAAIKRLDPK